MRYVLVHLLIGMLTARYRAGPPIWAVSAPLPLEIDYSQFRPLPIAVGRFAISGDKALYRVVRIGLPTDRYADRPLLVPSKSIIGDVKVFEVIPPQCLLIDPSSTTAYCLLRSLVENLCINPKSLVFGYLDEKPTDTGLMKFLGLCPSALSWYLEFASHSLPFRPLL
ncbi:hypothetical protein BHM03_00014111, partial [Ensete ventricosum]